MRATRVLRAATPPVPMGKYNHYLGYWGHLGGLKQKGIVSFGVSANRQNPFAGAAHDAVFNTWRRFSAQVLYWLPASIVGYYVLNWTIERNAYLNTKEGRRLYGGP